MTNPAAPEEISQDELLRAGRKGIISVLIVQWLVLLVIVHADDFGLHALATLWGQTVCLTLTLAVPSSIALCLTDWRDRRLWFWASFLGVVYAVAGTVTGYRLSGAEGLSSVGVIFPYTVAMTVLSFVATPFAQCRLIPSPVPMAGYFPYPDLFRHAWNNALTLVIAGIFTGLFWLVVALACGLFAIIGVKLVGEIVFSTVFIMPVTGLVLGIGVIAGRTQHRAVLNLRRIVLAILRGLLPIVAVIAVVFIAALPATGLEPLWETGKAGLLLMALMLAIVIFVNGVFQDGTGSSPYGPLTRRLVELSLLTLPVYGALAAYGLYLRVEQYGWSGERFWAVLICLFLSLYAVGYAYAAVREWLHRGKGGAVPQGWLAPMGPQNISVAALLLLVLFAVQLPWINPDAVTVRSQLHRLTQIEATLSRNDIAFLRFDAGRDGVEALTILKTHPKFTGDHEIVASIDEALTAKDSSVFRYLPASRFPAAEPATTVQQARDNLVIVPANHAVAPEFLQLFLPEPHPRLRKCRDSKQRCVVVAGDMDRDGRPDYTVIDLNDAGDIMLFAQVDGTWKKIAEGRILQSGKQSKVFTEALLQNLQKGHFAPQRPHLDMLTIGGNEIIFNP